jgi:2-dehydro-3-deoxyphosphooctonate aldolase (KDO 8-P synthase)
MSDTISRTVTIGDVKLSQDSGFTLIAGPCAIESRDHAMMMAEALVGMTNDLGISFIFKSSFDKANRTSASSARGVGLEQGVNILGEIRERFGCPVLTDVHESYQCAIVAEKVDVLQIPAFLCRQSDLLQAAAATGRAVNVKKGQFLAPWDMAPVVRKLEAFGCEKILCTERGTSFGYNTLVTDMRGIPQLADLGWPVVFDATHSVQQPGGLGGKSGGQREYVPILARAAISLGVAGLFVETHDNPDEALSDGPNMVPLSRMREFLEDMQCFDQLSKTRPLIRL